MGKLAWVMSEIISISCFAVLLSRERSNYSSQSTHSPLNCDLDAFDSIQLCFIAGSEWLFRPSLQHSILLTIDKTLWCDTTETSIENIYITSISCLFNENERGNCSETTISMLVNYDIMWAIILITQLFFIFLDQIFDRLEQPLSV